MRQTTLSALLLVLASLCACEHEEILLNKPNENIRSLGAFLNNNFEYTLFSAALEYTGLMDTLLGQEGTYTVLAPNDAAFQALGVNAPSDFLTMDRDSLRFVLAYHILPYRLTIPDIPIDQMDLRYETLSGESLYANKYIFRNNYNTNINSNVTATMVTFSGSEVSNAVSINNLEASTANVGDVVLSNGVLHSITKVMKIYPEKTVQQWLAEQADYSIFVAGLKHFGLWDELAGEGPFTIFAPTNDVFAQFAMTEASVSSMDVTQYVGARLFGAYIMYNKRFFIKDYHFYVGTQQQYWFAEPLRGDTAYNHILVGQADFIHHTVNNIYQSDFGHRFFPLGGGGFYSYDFSLGVSKGTTPFNYFTPDRDDNQNRFLGGGIDYYDYQCTGRLKERNDHLCANGMVHTIDYLVVHPGEALITFNDPYQD